jgi:dihydrofolate reductase
MSSDRRWRGRVFIAMSLDGFIARADSDLEWLTDPPAEIEHELIASDRRALEWDTFLPSIDFVVMGRGTYDKAITFDVWPYRAQQVVVLSTTMTAPDDPPLTVARSVAETARLLSKRDAREVYVDGGRTIQAFLEADLIDEITVAVAPVLIGSGIPLFGRLGSDVRLRLRAAHASGAGMTHATYEVVRTPTAG